MYKLLITCHKLWMAKNTAMNVVCVCGCNTNLLCVLFCSEQEPPYSMITLHEMAETGQKDVWGHTIVNPSINLLPGNCDPLGRIVLIVICLMNLCSNMTGIGVFVYVDMHPFDIMHVCTSSNVGYWESELERCDAWN